MKAVIVYAYGKDAYMERQYAEIVGVFTSTRKMLAALRADGLTKRQYDARVKGHAYDWQLGQEVQVEYDNERGDNSAYRLEPIELNKTLN